MRYKFALLPFKKTFYITSLSFGIIPSLDSRKLGKKEGKEQEHALTEVLPTCAWEKRKGLSHTRHLPCSVMLIQAPLFTPGSKWEIREQRWGRLSASWILEDAECLACSVAWSRPTLCSSVDGRGSSVHGILPARILEWVVISSSRGPSRLRNWTCISYIFWTGRQVLYHGTNQRKPSDCLTLYINQQISSVQYVQGTESGICKNTRPPSRETGMSLCHTGH